MAARRRILALLTDGYGGRGGIAKFNRDYLSAIISHPSTARVVALPRLAPEPPTSLPRGLDYRLEGLGGKSSYITALSRICALERFDLVICAHINLLPVAVLPAAVSGAKTLLNVHGIDAWEPTPRRLTNYLAGKVDAFVAVSELTKQRFSGWTGLASTKGFVLPNCVDLSGIAPGPKRQDLAARYGLVGRKIIMTLARLSASERYKGIDEVLEVLPALRARNPELAYLVAGDGDDRPRLQAKAQGLGLDGHVVFAGQVSEVEKADHYRLADVFVMPSRGEGFGIVFLEAMACGIPVVASKLDASREAVRDGELGVVVDPNDPRDLEVGILRALARPHGIVPSGLDYFSYDNFEQRVHALLDSELVASR